MVCFGWLLLLLEILGNFDRRGGKIDVAGRRFFDKSFVVVGCVSFRFNTKNFGFSNDAPYLLWLGILIFIIPLFA